MSETIPRRSNRPTSPGRCLALPLLLAIACGEAALGADFGLRSAADAPSADPGPRPPGGAWVWPGSQLDPGSEEPVALLGPHLFPPRPELAGRYWVVETRGCPQEMGTDPWPCLRASQFDGGGFVPRDPSMLLAQAAGRPVVVVVHGNLVEPILAINAGVWAQDYLDRYGVLPPDAVVVAFSWPSQRVYDHDVRDLAEKVRRAHVAGWHLARLMTAFPPATRVGLVGQSNGGLVVTAALHLLGGGCLDDLSGSPMVRLPELRPDLRLRAVSIQAAVPHFGLNPGRRFDRALGRCEGYLNLYSPHDEALDLALPLPIGRIGLTRIDAARIGPLLPRYEERDLRPLLGKVHTLSGAVAHPTIARWMAPYLWASGQ
jgi:hypothetical protein